MSGPGLALEYLQDPYLTDEKFVPNPWGDTSEHARRYNTGDLARVDENGVYHFCGRADLQVKVRKSIAYKIQPAMSIADPWIPRRIRIHRGLSLNNA